jgi:hypothetical protein
LSACGVLPWRCGSCHTRFHARSIPLRRLFYARCGLCGNTDLQRIAPEKVPGVMSVFGRVLGLPALRCEPCRHKFFSVRPLLPLARPEEIAAENSTAKY